MEFLKKLNDWIFQVERVIVVASLSVMSVIVFLSVAHRRYADPESVIAGKLASWFFSAERDSQTWQTLQDAANPISLVLILAIVYFGFRSASHRPLWNRGDESGKTRAQIHGEPLSHLKCLIYSVLTVIGMWLVMAFLFGTGSVDQSKCMDLDTEGGYRFACGYFPAGLNWAQPLALILTLWVSFIGASMAAKENLHLKVEAVQQALPEKLRRISGLISGLFTAAFCVLFAYLSYTWVVNKHEEWQIAEGLGALHDGLPIPYFVSFSIVPIAYLLMGARFVALGVLAFKGELEETPAELRDLAQYDAETPTEDPSTPESERLTLDAHEHDPDESDQADQTDLGAPEDGR